MSNPAFAVDILRAYEETLDALPQRSHVSWLAHAGLTPPSGEPMLTAGRRLHTRAWATALGLPCIPFSVFHKTANRLALLPRPLLWRVLRTRALLHRRRALCRCIDPLVRTRLASWLQPAVLSAVLREAPESIEDTGDLPLPLTIQHRNSLDDALAQEGFWLFDRDALWDVETARLIRLCFAREATDPLADAVQGRGRRLAAKHSQWVLDRLDRFVPEAAWLSG